MKFTEIQRCIIAVNIIGVILDEYDISEETAPIKNLKEKCAKFRDKQSGTEEKIVQRKKRGRVVSVGLQRVIINSEKHRQYMDMNTIGDKIWNEAIDHFAKQKLKIDAVSLVESIYLFNENILNKYAKIKRDDIDAYRNEHHNDNSATVLNGTAVGGHLMGLLSKEMGVEFNGKLRALRLKIEDKKKVA